MTVMTKPQCCILLLTLLCALSVAYGQEEEIVIDNRDTTGRHERAVVHFSHELHMDIYECLDCHHDYDNGENILDEGDLEEGNPAIRCASCHDSGATFDLRHAYHFQCMGCHRLTRLNGQATGPELCGECHIQ